MFIELHVSIFGPAFRLASVQILLEVVDAHPDSMVPCGADTRRLSHKCSFVQVLFQRVFETFHMASVLGVAEAK